MVLTTGYYTFERLFRKLKQVCIIIGYSKVPLKCNYIFHFKQYKLSLFKLPILLGGDVSMIIFRSTTLVTLNTKASLSEEQGSVQQRHNIIQLLAKWLL